MTLTPPLAGDVSARRHARWLLDGGFCGHCRTFCMCLPYGKLHGNKFPNLFRKAVSIKPVASARRQASHSFSGAQAVSNRRPDIVQVLPEARLAKHISSLRRTACRPKSVRLHAFHAALAVDVAAFLAVAVVGSCGILAANIVGVCGIVCGNGRGRLRRSCGKISSKPAASVVDQPLTDVRGQASPLFLWVPSECAPTTNHALFLPLGVGCWLRRNVLEPLLPDASVVRHWPSQLLMRSEGPRGPTAIACPVTTPNQSLRLEGVGLSPRQRLPQEFSASRSAMSDPGSNAFRN